MSAQPHFAPGRCDLCRKVVYERRADAKRAAHCLFSLALDRGIDLTRWTEDVPLHVHIERGRLVPAVPAEDGNHA